MGISIRDPEVERLAQKLAELRKTDLTEAIAHALRSEFEREHATNGRCVSGSRRSLARLRRWRVPIGDT